jgi:two-component system, chemotaxis family, protein-glutamate methylesterase/glutaminase
MAAPRRTNVFIIDDSALMRQVLTSILSSDPSLHVVGTAPDPVSAWRKIKDAEVDVITLDVEMPRMDGLTFLDKLMQNRPMPVVMVSSLTERGCQTTIRALELGAVDFVTKPKLDLQDGTTALGSEIISKVKLAARVRVRRRAGSAAMGGEAAPAAHAPAVQWSGAAFAEATHRVICIGASTGGTEALRVVLTALPADSPGIVIVQHMPERFTKSFADRLNELCRINVREAVDGDRVMPGLALIAPGNKHMRIRRSGAEYRVEVVMEDPVNRHRPSVDVLFESAARALGPNAVAVMLTGMGNDGARSMKLMRDAGARTIAQDEATCVVFGMPREAIEAGAVEEVLPLESIAGTMLRAASGAAMGR